MSKRLQVTEGEQYGNYTVLSDKAEIGKDHKTWFNCRCLCGKVEMVSGRRLLKDGYRSCKSCVSRHNYNIHTKHRWDVERTKYVGDISGTYFSHIKQTAKTRGIEFNLSKEFLWELFLKQEQRCALSGRDITLSVVRKKSDPDFSKISASLDRIDSSKGYTEDNVQWVHKFVNTMKMDLRQEDFIAICKEITEVNMKKCKSAVHTFCEAKAHDSFDEFDDSAECAGGVCPVR